MATIGVVTGLAVERDCLTCFAPAERPPFRVAGAKPERAAAAAVELIRAGCQGVISYGIAGGLVPGLAAGTIVIADRVLDAQGRALPTDAAWRERLIVRLAHGTGIVTGAVAGSDRAIGSPEAKAALARSSGALAVDMESHAVGRSAARLGIPFLVIRAIADTAEHGLPGWLAGVIDAQGRTRIPALVSGLLTHPADLQRLIGLGRATGRALAALRRLALDAGPLFAFDVGR